MFYVFDLDGTLADASHRLHHIEKTPKDWAAFKAAQFEDKPIPEIIALLHLLHAEYRVEIWTGRSEDTREATREWLTRHGISGGVLMRMRSENDRREDYEVKQAFLKHGTPALIFEDRRQMVDMWRSKGIRVAHVADGNY